MSVRIPYRPRLILSLAGLLLLATPTAVLANSMAGFTIFDFPALAPLEISRMTTWWLLVGIVVIEAFVLTVGLRIRPHVGLLVSVVVNIVSTIVGIVVAGLLATILIFSETPSIPILPLIPLAFLLLLIWWLVRDRKRFPGWFSAIAIVTLVGGFFAAPMFIQSGGLGLLSAMIFGFGLSVLSEGLTAASILLRSDIWKAVVVANVLSYLLIAVIAAGHLNALQYEHNPRASAWESRAKSTLRSIGSTQDTYQSANERHDYGSFLALQNPWYIPKGFTMSNMIESYSMTWSVNASADLKTEGSPPGQINTFTVIAWPAKEYAFLHTFGITEDQAVRVYNPENHNRLGNVQTWDPIL